MPKKRSRKKLGTIGLAALAAVTLGAVAFTVADGAARTQAQAVSPQVQDYYEKNIKSPTATPTTKPVTFAAVGDSVTEADSPDVINGVVGPGSWINYAAGSGVTYAGGWADGGAQSARMAANVKPVKADVLVIVAGTNDYGNSVPFKDSAANITTIVNKVGVQRVLISAVPPSDKMPEEAAAYNEELKAFTASKGWRWVDSSEKLRSQDNTFVQGMTKDGTHPTVEAARIIGQTIRAALQQA